MVLKLSLSKQSILGRQSAGKMSGEDAAAQQQTQEEKSELKEENKQLRLQLTSMTSMLDELRKEIREATETLLAIYAPKAAYSLTSILDNPDTFNARHIISASKEILDRTGLGVKTQMELEINTPTAMFFLPPKQGE